MIPADVGFSGFVPLPQRLDIERLRCTFVMPFPQRLRSQELPERDLNDPS